jgi:23S rRNA (adenine2503-C2)-methyltransferase
MDKKQLRNLSTAEIIGQVMLAKHSIGDFEPSASAPSSGGGALKPVASAGDDRLLSNIVFMGMGEPLLNYRNVKRALDILNDPVGSWRQRTES